MEDVPAESSPFDVNLDWALAAANERFARHGSELFRVRAIALKLCTLVGFAGVLLAGALQTTSKALAIAVLAVGVAPAIACAPGLVAATIAAARNEAPSPRMLAEHIHRAPGFAVLSMLYWLAVVGGSLGFVGPYVELRFSLARFLFIDQGRGVFDSFGESVLLTKGTTLARIKMAIVEPADALRNYGILRAGVDGRLRATIADALVYDYLSGNLAPPPDEASSGLGHSALDHSVERAPVLATLRRPVSADSARPAFVSDPLKPRCPRCGDEFLVPRDAPIHVRACRICAGAWLDTETSRALAENRLDVADVVYVMSGLTSRPPKPIDRSAAVLCPTCGASTSRTFLPAARVTVDACAVHGTWFDDGELVATARVIAKTASDREEIARLVAAPPKQENIYMRGLKVGTAEALDGMVEVASAGIDRKFQGKEEERRVMLESAALAALEILRSEENENDK